MKLKIGFASGDTESKKPVDTYQMEERSIAPRKSVVQVSFPAVFKGTLFSIAVDGKETGSFTLG